MYKFEADPVLSAYSEVSQPNPLRWQLLYREGDTFTPQTMQFRCKDYLNDVAGKYNGTEVIAYGMNTNNMKLNPEGTWLRLFNIEDKEIFMNNVSTCINKENPEHLLTMEVVDDRILMFVPRYYYNQTYLISLVTYMIRISNSKTKFKSLDHALGPKTKKSDMAIHSFGITLSLKWRYKVPESHQKYWTFYNHIHNNVDNPYTGTMVHNNGVMNWASGVTL